MVRRFDILAVGDEYGGGVLDGDGGVADLASIRDGRGGGVRYFGGGGSVERFGVALGRFQGDTATILVHHLA